MWKLEKKQEKEVERPEALTVLTGFSESSFSESTGVDVV